MSEESDPEVLTLPRAGVEISAEELSSLYQELQSVSSVGDELGVSRTSAYRLLDRAGIERRSPKDAVDEQSKKIRKRPYTDPDNLTHLHHEEGLSMAEIGEKYGMTGNGIAYWFDEHDIEIKNDRYDIPEWSIFLSDSGGYNGYPVMKGCDGTEVPVHHLVVIADGADPYDVFANESMNVHHRNGFKCDNRPSNLELVDRSEHGSKHSGRMNYNKKWTDDDLEAAIKFMLNPEVLTQD